MYNLFLALRYLRQARTSEERVPARFSFSIFRSFQIPESLERGTSCTAWSKINLTCNCARFVCTACNMGVFDTFLPHKSRKEKMKNAKK